MFSAEEEEEEEEDDDDDDDDEAESEEGDRSLLRKLAMDLRRRSLRVVRKDGDIVFLFVQDMNV